MISFTNSVKNEYKDFNREIKVYGILYLATKRIVNNEYVLDYTAFPLTEENNAKILSFTINEKADVYYTSVPYNTMTIEVDNETGYFTDYDNDSILDQLNEDCYVELYMNINNGDNYLIMTMNFDKISYSDYEKAKLNFFSNLARLENQTLKDKNREFNDWLVSFSPFVRWLNDNYNITLTSDHPDLENDVNFAIDTDFESSSVKDLILSNITFELGQLNKQGVLLTNNYKNELSFKAISNVVNETITGDLQLEKPIIKKEDTYKGVKYNWYRNSYQFEATSETYTKSFQGTLQSNQDRIIIADYDYKLSDITTSDITSSNNVNVVVETMAGYDTAMTLTITGTIGDTYELTINKSNMNKRKRTDLVTWPLGDTTDTSKILEVRDEAPIKSSMYVFLYIKKPIISNAEIRIMGLPYLEIGDTINIELENGTRKIFITEIKTEYNNGLLQTIKGYELDWTHQVTGHYAGMYDDLNDWDTFYPSNDLYPSNTLYPR